jgi:hypothetical protein
MLLLSLGAGQTSLCLQPLGHLSSGRAARNVKPGIALCSGIEKCWTKPWIQSQTARGDASYAEPHDKDIEKHSEMQSENKKPAGIIRRAQSCVRNKCFSSDRRLLREFSSEGRLDDTPYHQDSDHETDKQLCHLKILLYRLSQDMFSTDLAECDIGSRQIVAVRTGSPSHIARIHDHHLLCKSNRQKPDRGRQND